MMDLHTRTEILLDTAREYGTRNAYNARSGNVVAAAYRLAATKLHEQGSHQHAQDLELVADQAETIARLECGGIPREADGPTPSLADSLAEGRRLVDAFNAGRLSALVVVGLVPTLLDQLEGLLRGEKIS